MGEVAVAEFRDLIGRSHAPLKARLMDQHSLAGVGNLFADEVLWQAALDPRPADLALLGRAVTIRRCRTAS